MKSTNKYNLKEILDEVRACTLLCCTKNGEIYSASAEKYLKWLEEYTKFCIPEMVDEWKKVTRKIVYSPLVPKMQFRNSPETKILISNNDYEIIDDLYNFMNAGKIMETFNETHSWEKVREVIREQGHSGYTFSGLSIVMLQYSLIGVEFIDRFNPNMSKDKEFKKLYLEQKQYIEKRKRPL